MSTNELDVMTDEQAVEYYYRHCDEIEQEPGEPVDIELARSLSLAVSVRLRADRGRVGWCRLESSGHDGLMLVSGLALPQ